MIIRFTPDADTELAEARRWYAHQRENLDLEFMQLAEQVPGSLKVHRGRGKHVHRRVCRSFLPEDVVRRPKIGFKNAVDVWLRQRLGRQLRRGVLQRQARLGLGRSGGGDRGGDDR